MKKDSVILFVIAFILFCQTACSRIATTKLPKEMTFDYFAICKGDNLITTFDWMSS